MLEFIKQNVLDGYLKTENKIVVGVFTKVPQFDFDELRKIVDEYNGFKEIKLSPEEIKLFLTDFGISLAMKNRDLETEVSSLKAENEKLKSDNQGLRANAMIQEKIIESGHNPIQDDKMIRLMMDKASLESKIKKLKAERDKAIKDMEDVADGHYCKHCEKNPDSCDNGCVNSCSAFEWRGLDKEAEK